MSTRVTVYCKYSTFIDYKNFIYKDISLEFLIPLIEKLLKYHEKVNRLDFLPKTILLNNHIKNTDKNF